MEGCNVGRSVGSADEYNNDNSLEGIADVYVESSLEGIAELDAVGSSLDSVVGRFVG